ncbi:hypothetical protein A2382_03205 [Candidatus Woesebacteria bacterium RIFOXYB1_FULL_38_16]|uniref:Uncharacterized protein n=1 Tax=Candidatus Woesebacteria bacterium RIFOXYB1_FULL_38_16 TaxID=1802538 RepID=A0A1F8CVR2_9BACT|nr:MAG: hypothetical protein A2191_02790 [Candidatus Woesebacteria bacterium RIFOXYA1_FULL_38_9]OGM79909.1 MAG: hypothetical protein A2382_03205 [Candidatus Woesebacteria bacterium RIFOXYB1_FULL_38_16]
MLEIINCVIVFLAAIFMPLVAYPMAAVLCRARQKVDGCFEWDSESHEKREDQMTYLTAFVVFLVTLVGFGAAYVFWYTEYASSFLTWLGESIYLPISYWSVVYSIVFTIGWWKTEEIIKKGERS